LIPDAIPAFRGSTTPTAVDAVLSEKLLYDLARKAIG
jgi:hypothetical protein